MTNEAIEEAHHEHVEHQLAEHVATTAATQEAAVARLKECRFKPSVIRAAIESRAQKVSG